MKRAISFLAYLVLLTTGVSQKLSFKFGTPFQRKDLDVRWNVSTNQLPDYVWTYRLLPKAFSSAVVSNLMSFGSFTFKDLVVSNANEMGFKRDLSHLIARPAIDGREFGGYFVDLSTNRPGPSEDRFFMEWVPGIYAWHSTK